MRDHPQASEVYAAAQRAFAVETMQSLQEGAGLLERAAELGSAEALTQLAHFAASGVNQASDWDKSADMLLEAAERGSVLAADELRLLARGEGATPTEQRARVDFRAWIARRPSENTMEAPRIRVARGFMGGDECAWVIRRGAPRLEPATVYTQTEEGTMRIDERTNSAAAFRLLDVDLPLVLIHNRMAHTAGLPTTWFEPSALLHYAPGQCFAPHYDYLDASAPGYAADLAKHGQRIATLLAYLSDDYEGGETVFPEVGFAFKGKTGDLMAFGNVDLKGEPDRKTLHAGMPPTSGEKWLLSQWIRNRPMA